MTATITHLYSSLALMTSHILSFLLGTTRVLSVVVWPSGNDIGRIDKVACTLHGARLGLRWVTIRGFAVYLYVIITSH